MTDPGFVASTRGSTYAWTIVEKESRTAIDLFGDRPDIALQVIDSIRPATPPTEAAPGASCAPGAFIDARPAGPAEWTQRERDYHSIAELIPQASAVVVATATDTAVVQRVGGIPFTVRTFAVRQVLRGTLPNTVRVRELGLVSQRGTTEPGKAYVLFLLPFTFNRGGAQYDGQYFAVGGPAGVFLLDGTTVLRTDAESPDIPASIPLQTLAAQVKDN